MALISGNNPYVYTPTTRTLNAPTGTNPTASGPTATGPTASSETLGYSQLRNKVIESEEKVALAKKDLDAAEARYEKAVQDFTKFSNDAHQKYGHYDNWPSSVRDEFRQQRDFMTACNASVIAYKEIYNQAVKTHTGDMLALSAFINNDKTGTGEVPINPMY